MRLSRICDCFACVDAGDEHRLVGGNGILLENHVIRHMSDIEVLHTYEGTETMQTLIVGRDITGVSGFVLPRVKRLVLSPHLDRRRTWKEPDEPEAEHDDRCHDKHADRHR